MHDRPTKLQVFGERCSGTNFVAQLLRRNLPGLRLVDEFGWKHGYSEHVRDEAPECVFVVVHRDPFDWVRSLWRMPWHAAPALRERPLGEFLREPWWCQWGQDMQLAEGDPRLGTEMLHERDPATGERFATVMHLRAAKMRDWATLRHRVRHHASVRYEDVASEPRRFVADFARRFGLRRWPWFRPVRTFKGGRTAFVAKRYAPFAPEDLRWVVAQLDPDLERAAGYDVHELAARLEAVPGGHPA
jgi:hypothetical protein